MSRKYVLQRMPQTNEELWWWVVATWGVRIPRVKVCPDHCAPFDAFADAFFARSPVAIWKASRGFGGKTQLLSILGMSELVALGAFVTILGGSGAQSLRVHETMSEAWHFPGAPTSLLLKDPTKFDTYLTNGGKARTLMASTKSVRGPHPQRMRLDEIDEMELNVLESAQGQPMRKISKMTGQLLDTSTVMSSTHQYPDGTMTTMLKRAREEGWPVYHWCFRESANPVDGWLTWEEINRKKSEIPAGMWSAEYELQEPSFEGRAIDEASVDAMFNPELGSATGDEGKYVELEEPLYDRDYITAADWAKAKDYTVIGTWDATFEPWRLVAFERIARRRWPVMVDRLNRRWARYGGKVVHDETGIGGVVNDYIEFPKYAEPEHLTGRIMAGRARSDMITEYVNAIEKGLLIAPRIRSMYDEHRFVTPDDLYNLSSSAHLPDTVAMGVLAWSLRSNWAREAAEVDISMQRESSPWVDGWENV
ncbi:hypothetical protein [Streptomyces sp. NPDC006477]|uniref:hypothetical protein n=1 Tax=Streptomyces sp. NPDC006477 TaxID=3364747 RepID=UPI0036B95830